MTDRAINLRAWQVRAALEDRLGMVAEPLNPQPEPWRGIFQEGGCQKVDWNFSTEWMHTSAAKKRFGLWMTCQFHEPEFQPLRYAPGDRLWCRETWAEHYSGMELMPPHYRADLPDDPGAAMSTNHAFGLMDWESSAVMPRALSRLTLLVTDVRVMRVQDIGEADAVACGVELIRDGVGVVRLPDAQTYSTVRTCFAVAWDKTNGAGAWARNDWIAAYSVTVQHRNIDATPISEAE